MAAVHTCTIGYPRIGGQRETKTAVEKYWNGKCKLEELLSAVNSVQAAAWSQQKDAGVQFVATDGTFYDHVLDTIYWLGVVPSRFAQLTGYDQYFGMARGVPGATALDMSKFFDTNYHYIVPELEDGWKVQPNLSHFLDKVQRCQQTIGRESTVPAIIGPLTFACLARQPGSTKSSVAEIVDQLLPGYLELIAALKALGVSQVQVHEPILVTSRGAQLQKEAQKAFTQVAAQGVAITLSTYFDDLGDAYPWVVQLPVNAITLDFLGVAGGGIANKTLDLIRQYGFPADKTLYAGVVDGRAVWADAGYASAVVSELLSLGIKLGVTSSAPLYLLPLDLDVETALPAGLKEKLGFAKQKLSEIVNTAHAAKPGPQIEQSKFQSKDLMLDIDRSLLARSVPFEQRRDQQIQMPAFPTTSIGSTPQTAEIRRLRMQLKKGTISLEAYDKAIAAQIGLSIGVQEALGLDVLVHGEPERTDMVEYFAFNLEGIAFTQHGWVQSYGSRCTRPPILYSDVKFKEAMTVKEFLIAQSLTQKQVKGMLTGPITILNWSFPRKDITRRSQAFQLGLALRQEVAALESAGCKVIQVDDPALREGLPLKDERKEAYLTWAVEAFRLCTSVVSPATQIVTHLCYSDFDEIMGAIHDMHADVLTIENSRSDDAMLKALANSKYLRDVGPGVYDVHSPVIPTVEFMKSKIRTFLTSNLLEGRADRLWVNPDCGLKTRTWPQTIAALRNMVQAAKEMREELAAAGKVWGNANGAAHVEHANGQRCCC